MDLFDFDGDGKHDSFDDVVVCELIFEDISSKGNGNQETDDSKNNR